jgi:hypothetical protein
MIESGRHTIHFPDGTEVADIGSIRILEVGEVFERGGSSWRVTEVEILRTGWHITVAR